MRRRGSCLTIIPLHHALSAEVANAHTQEERALAQVVLNGYLEDQQQRRKREGRIQAAARREWKKRLADPVWQSARQQEEIKTARRHLVMGFANERRGWIEARESVQANLAVLRDARARQRVGLCRAIERHLVEQWRLYRNACNNWVSLRNRHMRLR